MAHNQYRELSEKEKLGNMYESYKREMKFEVCLKKKSNSE